MARINPIKPISASRNPIDYNPDHDSQQKHYSQPTQNQEGPRISMVGMETGPDGQPLLGEDYLPGKYIDVRV